MNQKNKEIKSSYYGILLLIFLALISIKIVDYGLVYACSTLIWLIGNLYLLHNYTDRKYRIIAGFVFVIGYCIRFFGFFGNVIFNIVFFCIFSVFIYSLFLLYAWMIHKWKKCWVTILFPLLWLLAYLLCTLIRIPSLMRIDIFFFSFKTMIQCEAIITSLGFSYCILWFCALIAFALSEKDFLALISALCVILGIYSYGFYALAQEEEPEDSVTIAYTTGPYTGDFVNYFSIDYETSINSLAKSVREASDLDVHILVFNEEAFEVEKEREREFIQEARNLAIKYNMNLFIGLDVMDYHSNADARNQNKIVYIDSHGTKHGEYLKFNTIPFMEGDYQKGDGLMPSYRVYIDGDPIDIAFAICYDSNFPFYMSQMDEETELLILPSWDWKTITSLHKMITGILSVENKVPLLKPTYDGISIAVDSYGRIIKESNTDESGYEKIELVTIPIEKNHSNRK